MSRPFRAPRCPTGECAALRRTRSARRHPKRPWACNRRIGPQERPRPREQAQLSFRLASFRPRLVNAPDIAHAMALGLHLGRYHHAAALVHDLHEQGRKHAGSIIVAPLGLRATATILALPPCLDINSDAVPQLLAIDPAHVRARPGRRGCSRPPELTPLTANAETSNSGSGCRCQSTI